MPSKTEKDAEKEAERLRTATLEEGQYAALESDDNAIDASNEAYVGVDPAYRNHAYDINAPLVSDDEDAAEAERAAKDREKDAEERASRIGPHGYEPNAPHPSEAVQPATEAIQQNRSIQAAAVAAAEAKADSGASDDDASAEGSTPFNG